VRSLFWKFGIEDLCGFRAKFPEEDQYSAHFRQCAYDFCSFVLEEGLISGLVLGLRWTGCFSIGFLRGILLKAKIFSVYSIPLDAVRFSVFNFLVSSGGVSSIQDSLVSEVYDRVWVSVSRGYVPKIYQDL
jgi:hypothetical protein